MPLDANNQTFGQYVRALRERRNIGLREMARRIDVSAPYLNDIEKDKRGAPRPKLVEAMAKVLDADVNRMLDLAGASRNDVAADIAEQTVGQRRNHGDGDDEGKNHGHRQCNGDVAEQLPRFQVHD